MGVRFPAEFGVISLSDSVHTGFRARLASCTVGTGGCFPGIKRLGREADHSPPSYAEIKNAGKYTIPLLTILVRDAWLSKGTT
jgi:hypothetical protein